MTTIRLLFALTSVVALAAGCGGDQSKKSDPGNSTGDLDTASGDNPIASNPCGNPCAADGTNGTNGQDGNPCGGDPGTDEPPAPAVTFELKNTWSEDLVFNLDAGWGLIVQVYSGKRPKAVAVEPWPRYCTASCDTEGADKCPVCKKPERISKIRKAEKRQVIEPGKSFELEWDTTVHSYEKVKRGCQCFTTGAIADATYTVRACGLRLSKKHKKRSKLQCVLLEDALTFPASGPQRVVIDFGDPKPKKKASR